MSLMQNRTRHEGLRQNRFVGVVRAMGGRFSARIRLAGLFGPGVSFAAYIISEDSPILGFSIPPLLVLAWVGTSMALCIVGSVCAETRPATHASMSVMDGFALIIMSFILAIPVAGCAMVAVRLLEFTASTGR